MPWGPPQEVARRIITAADSAGAGTVQVSLNRGVLPHEMFIEQIRRFARDVLPALHAHEVAQVPLADALPA
jgi:hypothetical protein